VTIGSGGKTYTFIDDLPLLPTSNILQFATVAQLVEQLIRNQQVSGSNPLSSSIRTL
jgi:hypothetical protein